MSELYTECRKHVPNVFLNRQLQFVITHSRCYTSQKVTIKTASVKIYSEF